MSVGPLMRVDRLELRNFRCFAECTIDWHPQLTMLVAENGRGKTALLSCDALDHCGHHKDRVGSPYDPVDLVKPDEHDPDDHFYFHSSGEVRVRSGLNAIQSKRATETIGVFHLHCGALQAARRRAVEAYQRKDPGILETLCEFDEASRRALIDDEIVATARDPHSSVIRHLFEKI